MIHAVQDGITQTPVSFSNFASGDQEGHPSPSLRYHLPAKTLL